MRFHAAIALLFAAGLGGCTARPETAAANAAAPERSATGRRDSSATGARAMPSKPKPPVAGEAVALAAYAVRESAFTDFGMSVKTNLAVQWGGPVEWMEVSGVVPASSAARQNLRAGDRILAIDGQLVTKFGRDSMLDALFQRQAGDRVELLVLGPRQGLPRDTTVTAERAHAAK